MHQPFTYILCIQIEPHTVKLCKTDNKKFKFYSLYFKGLSDAIQFNCSHISWSNTSFNCICLLLHKIIESIYHIFMCSSSLNILPQCEDASSLNLRTVHFGEREDHSSPHIHTPLYFIFYPHCIDSQKLFTGIILSP